MPHYFWRWLPNGPKYPPNLGPLYVTQLLNESPERLLPSSRDICGEVRRPNLHVVVSNRPSEWNFAPVYDDTKMHPSSTIQKALLFLEVFKKLGKQITAFESLQKAYNHLETFSFTSPSFFIFFTWSFHSLHLPIKGMGEPATDQNTLCSGSLPHFLDWTQHVVIDNHRRQWCLASIYVVLTMNNNIFLQRSEW